MRFFQKRRFLAALLLLISLTLYTIHFTIFRDSKNIFFYGLMDIAFIPISVLLVSMVIDGVIARREKENIKQKMNMVIGVFFSEVGIKLLRDFAHGDQNTPTFNAHLLITPQWKATDFSTLQKKIPHFSHHLDSRTVELNAWRNFLIDKRGFLLGLLENPNLLEHETFTDLLWAVFHLTEELALRKQVSILPAADYDHLSGDLKRAYSLLLLEWAAYMSHLSQSYPYLFSLAVRTNPFNEKACVEFN